jgi:hypothetical protein
MYVSSEVKKDNVPIGKDKHYAYQHKQTNSFQVSKTQSIKFKNI